MATLEQEKEYRASLRTELEQLTAIEADSLVRADELGQTLSFQEGLPYFQQALGLFRELAEADLDTLPFQRLQELAIVAEHANSQFSEIQKFSLESHPQNPTQIRDSFINNIRDSYDDWFKEVVPIITYSRRKGSDFARFEQEAREQASRVVRIGTELQSKGEKIVGEVQEVLEQVRRAAQEVGVSQHAVQFKSEAVQHETAAKKWLIAVMVLASLTGVLTIVNVIYYAVQPIDITTAQTIQLAVAKVILFSLLFSALVWTGRVYRSHQHNFVVNQHRQNALISFETFAKAANDDQTKSAVLLQATNCIFSPQASGYADSSTEGPGSPRIMEIVRNMAARE